MATCTARLRPPIVIGLAANEGRGRVGIEKQGLLRMLNPKMATGRMCTSTYKEDQPAPANVSSMTRRVSNRHTHIRIPPPAHPG